MRRLPALALALVALVASPSGAGTPVWVETFVAEHGTMTIVDGSRSGTALAVIGGGTTVKSTDYGLTWVPLGPLSEPPNGGSSQTRVAVADAKRFYAENGRAVSTSVDAGTTWRELSIPPVVRNPKESFEFADAVAAAEGSRTVAVGWGGARVVGLCPYVFDFTPVYVSHDGGARWRRTDLPVTGDVWQIEWYDARRAAVTVQEIEWEDPHGDDRECGASGIGTAQSVWVTSDGGATWRLVFRVKAGRATAAWSSPTSITVVAEVMGVGAAYVSNDSGRHFLRGVNLYTTAGAGDVRLAGFPSLEYVDGRRGWVAVLGMGTFRTDNGGTEWAHEISPFDGSAYGVHDFTAFDKQRAAVGGPRSLVTRVGEAVTGAPVPGALRAPAATSVETVIGGVRRVVTRSPYGDVHVTLSVERGA